MHQVIKHGVTIDAATPEEVAEINRRLADSRQFTPIRATETGQLSAAGAGLVEVYKVPLGMNFYVRRVSLTLSTATDPSTGAVQLNATGVWVKYLRSGAFIEFGYPKSPVGAVGQIPGVQTWSAVEGPFLSNGEVFEVQASGLTANAGLSVFLQGELHRPAKVSDN